MKKYSLILITVPYNKSSKIKKYLLNKKLVACVNEIKTIFSSYWWENKICNDKESLLILKTKSELVKNIINFVKKIHPYEVPEIISFEISQGNKDYFLWLNKVLQL